MTYATGTTGTGQLSTDASGTIAATANGFDLTVPTASGATTFAISNSQTFSTTANGATIKGAFTSGIASNLTYSTYGAWETTSASGAVTGQGVFAAGIPGGGQSGDRPASGSAAYSGKATGYASLSSGEQHLLNGNVTLNANFGANTILGSVTGITTQEINATTRALDSAVAAADITLSAGVITGTAFSGTAMAGDPGNIDRLQTQGAVGTFGGHFYGVGAAEAAGSMQLTKPDMNIIASFGAKQ
jgi:hypothetical protein